LPGSYFPPMQIWEDSGAFLPGSWMKKGLWPQKRNQKEKTANIPKSYFCLFPMTLSHPHSQSGPPSLANWGWWQSICCKLLLRIRPFSETMFHSTMTNVLSLSLGQEIRFHSLSFLCCMASSLLLTISLSFRVKVRATKPVTFSVEGQRQIPKTDNVTESCPEPPFCPSRASG
jgi:hypothetical protein